MLIKVQILSMSLEKILRIAAIAPGNYARFLKAGLIAQESNLLPDWESAFARIEPIDKQRVRSQPGDFLVNAKDIVYRGMTSGTKGIHFTYFAGQAWNQARLAARVRSLLWWGIDEQIPIVNVASRLQPIRSVDLALVGEINSALIDSLIDLLSSRLTVIRGYPSRLYEVAVQLQSIKLPAVKAVISTGECLYEFQRSLLTKVFQAPVIDEYGCQETGISGFTCPEAGQLHLDSDRCLYEIIDGELVSTDLFNETMPMIRYRCGDVLEISSNPCTCGRPGPTAKVLGRVEDRIYTLQDRAFAGPIKIEPMKPLSPEQTCSAQDWITALTKGKWQQIFSVPTYPEGIHRSVVDLMTQLIQPNLISNSALPPSTQSLIQTVLQLPKHPNAEIESMIVRSLSLACTSAAHQPEFAAAIYHAALARQPENGLDRSIAGLAIADSSQKLPVSSSLDRLNIHHLLKAFEILIQTRKASVAIAPVLPILVGDFTFFAPRFSSAILSHWFMLFHGQSLPLEGIDDPFLRSWLMWRYHLLEKDRNLWLAFSQLENAAQTPLEQARVQLEEGYGELAMRQTLDPEKWLPRIQQHAGILTQGLPSQQIDPIPWSPILRAIAPALLKAGQSELAYQCLMLSTCPTSTVSNFERHAQVNGKQSVLGLRSQ
jgi:phenylacetate-CoA ligase